MGYQTTPSAGGYATSHNYIDTMSIAYNQSIRKPEVDGKIVRGFGNDMITGFLESMGSFEAVNNLEFFHVEKDRIKEILNGTCTAAGANVKVEFTITNNGTVALNSSPYNTSNTLTQPFSVARVGDVLLFPNGVQAKVHAKPTATTLDLYPTVLGTQIPTTIASDQVVVLSHIATEFQGERTSYNTKTWTYKNQLTHHYDTHKVSATAMGEKTWFNNLGESGNESKWWYEGNLDTYKNVMTDCEQFMVVGKEMTNTTLTELDQTSAESTAGRGIVTDIQTYGNVETYTAGSFSLTDLKNIGKNLVQNKGARENTWWVGYELKTELDDLFRGTTGLTNGGVMYSEAAGSAFGEARRIAFEFDHVSYGGYKHFIKHLEMFDNPTGLGAVGQTYTNLGLIMPNDDVVVEQFQGSSSIGVRSVRLRYLDIPNYTRGYREWASGGALDTPTDPNTQAIFTYDVYRGIELSGLNRFSLVTV